jgi:hypothetical protein
METETVAINATVESWATALTQGKRILVDYKNWNSIVHLFAD